jgi:hypothetical protein
MPPPCASSPESPPRPELGYADPRDVDVVRHLVPEGTPRGDTCERVNAEINKAARSAGGHREARSDGRGCGEARAAVDFARSWRTMSRAGRRSCATPTIALD